MLSWHLLADPLTHVPRHVLTLRLRLLSGALLVHLPAGLLRDRPTVPSGGGPSVDVDSGSEVGGYARSPAVTEANPTSDISRDAGSVVAETNAGPEVGGDPWPPLVTQTHSSSNISIQSKSTESSSSVGRDVDLLPAPRDWQGVVADSLEGGDALLTYAGGGGDALSLHDGLALLLLHGVVLSRALGQSHESGLQTFPENKPSAH